MTPSPARRRYWVDPPDGWRHGFPVLVDEDVLRDPARLRELALSRGYSAGDWDGWAGRYVRAWSAS